MVNPVNKKLAKLEGAKLQNILGLPSPFPPIRSYSAQQSPPSPDMFINKSFGFSWPPVGCLAQLIFVFVICQLSC